MSISGRKMVGVATAEIIEQAILNLQGVPVERAMKIWKSVGVFIHAEMIEENRGTRLEKLGTFGFNNAQEPVFALAPEFSHTNRVRPSAQNGTLGPKPTNKLSYSKIASLTDTSRDTAKKVIERIILQLGKVVKDGKSSRLSFQPLGEFVCKDDTVRLRFNAEFVKDLKISVAQTKNGAKENIQKRSSKKEDLYKGLSSVSENANSRRTNDRRSRPQSARSASSYTSSSSMTASSISKRSINSRSSTQNNDFKLPMDVASYYSEDHSPERCADVKKELNIVEKVKSKILERGGSNGINAISRVLRIMDDSGDKRLSKDELKFGLRDYGIDLTSTELGDLMNFFDTDKDGTITFDEFLVALRGDLNERRLELINMAFKVVDKTGDGVVDIDDLIDVYDVSMHPEVRGGKKTKEQVLNEFIVQWDTHEKDGVVTQEEFRDYYKGVSASIDDDDYFELMIRNAWHISGGKGVCENTANERALLHSASGREYVAEVNEKNASKIKDKSTRIEGWSEDCTQSLIKDELYYLHEILYSPPVTINELVDKIGANRVLADGCEKINVNAFAKRLCIINRKMNMAQALKLAKGVDFDRNTEISLPKLLSKFEERFGCNKKNKSNGAGAGVIERVKAKILARGGRTGFNGIQRTMKIMDDNGDKRLTKEELKNGLRDYGIDLNFNEVDQIMCYFDTDRNGTISFDEFITGIRGDMNERRLSFVHKAYKILDKNGDGRVTVDDLRLCYDVSKNPDVLAGRITERQALVQFLEQWDTQDKDGIVTLAEFENYYRNISASIDGDDYFELMMRNAWHISGGEGQCANTSNQRVLVTDKDGTQTVQEIKNDIGIKKKDQVAMKNNLQGQGIDVAGSVTTSYGLDARSKKSAKARLESERNMRKEAAMKVQTNFRGLKGRKFVETVKRKQQAEKERNVEVLKEQNREKNRLKRTALRGHHGF